VDTPDIPHTPDGVLVLVVTDHAALLTRLPRSLDAYRSVIGGGWLEGLYPAVYQVNDRALPPWRAYCDEDGLVKGLPRNLTATRLARAAGWTREEFLHGPVMFIGDRRDDDGDVPAPLVTLARAFITMPEDPYWCRGCGQVAWHPNDSRLGYCATCHTYAVDADTSRSAGTD
jgi:hypothetical protein